MTSHTSKHSRVGIVGAGMVGSSAAYFVRQELGAENEFVNGASRNNYGQDAHLNAFVNLVSLAGAGMTGGYLCSVREGNNQLCQGLLRVLGAKVRTDCHVRQIARFSEASNESYTLLLDGGETERFDAVIIATPLEGAEITIQEITLPETARLRRAYQTTHVTLVVGHLNPM